MAGKFRRETLARFGADPCDKFCDGRIQSIFDCQSRNAFDSASFPDDVQDHAFKTCIRVVTMSAPATRMQVHFDVASHRRFAIKLNNRLTEIRAALMAPKAGMQDLDAASVERHQAIA